MCECNLFLDAFNRLLKSGKYYFTKKKWEFRVGCIFSSDFPCGREVGKRGTKNRNSDGKWRKTDVNKDSPAPPMSSFATSGCQLPGNVFKVLATLNPVCVEVSPKCGLSLMKSAYTLISLSNKTVCFVWMRIYCTSYEFIFILFISVRAACGWTWKHYDAQWQNEWMNGYRICLFTVYNISTVFSFAFCTDAEYEYLLDSSCCYETQRENCVAYQIMKIMFSISYWKFSFPWVYSWATFGVSKVWHSFFLWVRIYFV